MKHTLIIATVLVCVLVIHMAGYGQGCSDAGFCTLGSLKQGADSITWKQKITFISSAGVGDEGVFVLTPALQYDLRLSPRWTVQGKITGNYANGNLGTATGAGDVFLTATCATIHHRRWKKSWLLGGKFPLNNGNLTDMGRSLPMQYQSSLGTVDLIAGITLNDERWQFSVAWQQPLSGSNSNNFLPAHWDTLTPLPTRQPITSTAKAMCCCARRTLSCRAVTLPSTQDCSAFIIWEKILTWMQATT